MGPEYYYNDDKKYRHYEDMREEKYSGYNSPYNDKYQGTYTDYDDYKAYAIPAAPIKTEAEIAEDKRVAKAVALARAEAQDENYFLQDSIAKAEAARYQAEKRLDALMETMKHLERPLFDELVSFLKILVDTREPDTDDVEAWAFQDGHNEVIGLLMAKLEELKRRA